MIYQFRVAAGNELYEVQLADSMSPGLYRGWVPLISGPYLGRSTKIYQIMKTKLNDISLPITRRTFVCVAV